MDPINSGTSAEDTTQVQPTPAPSADGYREAAETAQEQEKEQGFFTQLGEFFSNAFDPDGQDQQNLDITKQIYEGLGGEVDEEKFQEAKELIPTVEETEAKMAEVPIIGKPMVAIAGGMQDGVMLPFTGLAGLANEEATWDNRPAVIKDDLFAETIYDITKIMTPMLLLRNPMAGLGIGAVGSRIIETGIETASVDSADDLIGGRTAAEAWGKTYGAIIGNEEAGIQLTRDLIEGNKASVQPFLRTWAFLQNYAINAGGEKAFESLGLVFKKLWKNIADVKVPAEEVAAATGKSTDEVVSELGDIKQPEYSPDLEPDEAVNANTIGLNPTAGNNVNESAVMKKLMAEARGEGLDPEDPANYFYNWASLASEEETVAAIKTAFLGKQALEPGSVARARVIAKSARFILDNFKSGQSKEEMLQSFIELSDLTDEVAEFVSKNPDSFLTKDMLARQAKMEEYFENFMNLPISTENGVVGIAVSRYMAEQGGLQLRNVAEQIALKAEKGLPYDHLVDNVLIPNQKFLRVALAPLRRAKRQFYLMGEAQQQETFADLQRALGEDPTYIKNEFNVSKELQDTQRKNPGLKVDGKRITITDIEGAGDIEIDTLEQIWGLTKSSAQAKQIFELAMDNIRFGDPGKTIDNLNLTSNIIKEAIKDKEGFKRYFYNVVALGQLGTQTNAVGATVFRQALEPLALMAAGINPLVKSSKAEDAVYGMGMFLGGMAQVRNSFRAGRRAYSTNTPSSGNTRAFGANYTSNLVKELNQIKELHMKDYLARQEAGENVFETYARWIGDRSREIAYSNPANIPTRLLMAGDEAAKVTTGAQHAWGRALVRLANEPTWNPKQWMDQIKAEEAKIFKGPAWKGEITDKAVRLAGERQTLQEPFQKDMDPNWIEGWFKAQQTSNTISPVNMLFNAFPRVAYRGIEQEYVENLAGALPGSVRNRLSRKLKAIYNDPDPTVRLQLEGQKSLAQLVLFSTVMGGMISKSSTIENALGFEIPNIDIVGDKIVVEGQDVDYAIETGKFSPAQIMIALVGNLNEAFITGKTSEQDWASQMIFFGQLTLADIIDRNVLQGQQKFARLVDVDSKSWAKNVFGWLWDYVSPGLIREIAQVASPYEPIGEVRTTRADEIRSEIGRQSLGNANSTKLFDYYAPEKTNNPKPRVPTLNTDPSTGEARMSSLFSMFWPGRVTAERFNDPVFRMFTKSDFILNRGYIRTIGTMELTAPQQSTLSRALQGPLYKALAKFEKQDYPKLMKRYKKIVDAQGSGSDEAQAFMRDQIRSKITSVHYKVKNEAIRATPELINDPAIQEALEQQQEFNEGLQSNVPRSGLYATAANQSTELASQVRQILDIPS